jgi:hypothetical protein
MKQLFALLTLAVFVAFGCNSPSSSPTSVRVNDIHSPSNNDGPNSVTDIPTPSFTGATQSTGSSSGHKVCLDWQSNTPGYASGYSSYTTTPTDDNNFGHGSEYWGNTQNSMTGPGTGGHDNQPYSGHYELTRQNPDNTTTSLGDITADSYCDDNLADGTYIYYLKAKSLEGVQPNAMTHHSETSQGYTVVVESCTDVVTTGVVYNLVTTITLGTGSWTGSSVSSWVGDTWTETSLPTWNKNSGTNAHTAYNIGFNLNKYNWAHHTCPSPYYDTNPDQNNPVYTGILYASINGGATWNNILQYGTGGNQYYEINGSPTHGFGATTSNTTYTVLLSTSNTANSTANVVGYFYLHTN